MSSARDTQLRPLADISSKKTDAARLKTGITRTEKLQDASALSRMARIDYVFRQIERLVRNASREPLSGNCEIRYQAGASGKFPQISLRLVDTVLPDYVGPYIIFRADDSDQKCSIELFTKEKRQQCSLLDDEVFRRIKFVIKRVIAQFMEQAKQIAELRASERSSLSQVAPLELNEELVAIEVDSGVHLSDGESSNMRKMLGGIFGDTEDEAKPLNIEGSFDLEGSMLPKPERSWAGGEKTATEVKPDEEGKTKEGTTWILAKKKHTVVANRYVLRKLLGAGGMGAVFTAEDRETGRRVAVKILHATLAEDTTVLQRFEREVDLIRQVTNENVITIYDHGSHDDVIYYTMEYVRGLPLNKVVQGRKLKKSVLEKFAIKIAEGLSAIHGAGIIHRDLKGENVIVTEQRDVKIIDFGIARTHDSNLTSMGEVIGSPAYLAPELWRGETPTTASDIYALGVIFYRMAYGDLPFTGDNPVTVMNKHLHEEPEFSRNLLTTASPWFIRLTAALLEKDPALRPDVGRILRLLETSREQE